MDSLFFRKSGCSCHDFSNLVGKESSHTHTHALHELSNLFKISICGEICAYWILNSHLYLCIFLQCYLTLAICWPSSCTSGQDLYRFKTCFSFSAIHTSLHFYWFIISCCVFFLWISSEILAFFAHLFSSHDLHCVFHYSF
jgi:hypothetical protein